jgi:predicted acylesterase/phospholipase RssA
MTAGRSDVSRIAVALSGGGHRACLWGLGVLMYLTDSQRSGQVTSIASVSGGSLANAAIGHAHDYRTATTDELDEVVARVARRAATGGTVLAWWGTWAYLLLVALDVVAVWIVNPWRVDWAPWPEALVFAGALLVFSWLLTQRGRVFGRAFAHTLFSGTPRLNELHDGLDHVICATDLHAGEHVYFSGSFVAAYRFGLGIPDGMKLHRAVQASAAFPPVFPVAWIRTKGFRFQGGRPESASTRAMALTDGGVYDNMADQWAQKLGERMRRLEAPGPGFQVADELVVANASAGLGWASARCLRIPFVGALLALLRVKSVLYDNGTSVRRHELVDAFDLAEKTGSGLRGCLVHIEQSPFRAPDAFKDAAETWPRRARHAHEALAALGDVDATRAHWRQVAQENSRVSTTLFGLGEDRSARLLHHAYVLAMVNLHVILGYPLLAVPGPERFTALLARKA